jgi:two-component system sensor histidine kinase DegS
MLGYGEEELLTKSIPDIHPPEEFANDLERFQAAAEGRVSINEDRPVLRKDGSIFFADITGHRIVYRGRPCLLALFRDITERKQSQETLERERRTLKHMLEASDHERRLISYDIHDGLAQDLAGAIMQFQIYAHARQANPNDAAKAFDTGMAMLQQSHIETRRLISGVRPPILDESGVVAAIVHLVYDPAFEQGPKIEFRNRVRFKRLAPILENVIYRIVQEGLTNARKHSKSKEILVSLKQRGDRLRIEIRDWGMGFDPETVQENRFGLEGIRERARLLGGTCKIKSKPGKGAAIVVELPVAERRQEE